MTEHVVGVKRLLLTIIGPSFAELLDSNPTSSDSRKSNCGIVQKLSVLRDITLKSGF